MTFPSTLEVMLEFLNRKKLDDQLDMIRNIATLSVQLQGGGTSYCNIADTVDRSEPLAMEIHNAARTAHYIPGTTTEALIMLGDLQIKKIITLHSFRQIHKTFQTETPFDLRRKAVWTASYSHALLAQRCQDSLEMGVDIYLPSLFERTGIIIFNQFFFDDYSELLKYKPAMLDRYTWETRNLGYNSIEVGADYLQQMGLSDFAQQVRTQLTPTSDADKVRYYARKLSRLVYTTINGKRVLALDDDFVYDDAIICEAKTKLGSHIDAMAVPYLRSALTDSMAA